MESAINKKEMLLVRKGVIHGTLDQYLYEQKQQKAKYSYMWRSEGRKFTNAKMEAIKEVAQILGHTQLAYLMLLTTYIGYDDNTIRNTNKFPMSTSDMKKKLGVNSRTTFYNFLNTCLDNNIINKNEDGNYLISNKYHYKGKNKNNDRVVQVYNTEIRNAYKQMKPAQLGLFYLLLPYIHYQTNTLCYNPYEEDPTKLQKLNRKQVCDLIGINPSTFSTKILKAVYEEKPIIAEVKVLGERSYLVNPWVFYRSKIPPSDMLVGGNYNPIEPDKTLRSIFSV